MPNNYLTVTRNPFRPSNGGGKNTPDLTAYIEIKEALPPGKYEAGLFAGLSQKGNKIYKGQIREQWKRTVPHFQETKETEI